ncbi:phage replisome organizer N-terminal domain-containing protein [uncultured Anaerococcus sp.]|uniref:phage replisome organizer N-terminal domain-containing protein n=1 Tax=uncultured Anaerococcus sp. TaxID=293428 RepID=UPI00288BA7CD|nr:phage replisome organizer N-terminal domain-containing protein [uncultured Anaerococcus sp.]
MAKISWIKLSVNIFDDEKIKLIRKMPEGNSIILIWIQLLCMAGKTNDSGAVYMGQNMYYTDEMLATICDQPLNTIRLALETFRRFEMIEYSEEGLITIENWEKHQNTEGMERVKTGNAGRQRLYYWRKKLISVGIDPYQEGFTEDIEVMKKMYENKNLTLGLTLPHRPEIDIDIDKDKEIDKNISSDDVEVEKEQPKSNWKTQIIDEWNKLDGNIPKIQSLNPGTDRYKMLKARISEYSLDDVLKAIKTIDNSRFLKGYISTWNATFDWFVKPSNFVKVLEGTYNDKAEMQPTKEESISEIARRRRLERLKNQENK